jgi:hypothetical protein
MLPAPVNETRLPGLKKTATFPELKQPRRCPHMAQLKMHAHTLKTKGKKKRDNDKEFTV